jgi:peptide/nickel transport system ATP-binding protein
MDDVTLDVNSLNVSLSTPDGWRDVVKNISFRVGAGETVALVGESGSGKSVTALSLMGLLPAANNQVTGSARLRSAELVGLDEAKMRRVRGNEIAMIFQEPMTSLNPVLTVGDQIGEVLRRHRRFSAFEARQETLRLLDRVKIAAGVRRVDEHPHQMSGGMRQRIMIAMALACRPSLMIADEPTTALDVTVQAEILELIKELQDEEKMAVLFITHDMAVVAEIADRTLVMLDGALVESNSTLEIFRNSVHPYTRRLLAAVPRLGAMRGVDGPTPFAAPDGMSVASGNLTTDSRGDFPAKTKENQPPLLSVTGLKKQFSIKAKGLFKRSVFKAVDDVEFSIERGETLSLVGESGSGKSTTGRMLVRLLNASGGSVRLEGQEVANASGGQLRRLQRDIQMIFQDPYASLNPRMKVGEAVAEPMLLHGIVSRKDRRRRVEELFDLVGLSADMFDRYPNEFSGGQRQRISIARALSTSPKLIIADEAVAALDVSIKAQVINLMIDLQSRLGVSYLFISHDMAIVERVSHRVAVMYRGQIVEIGPRRAIFENPRHWYTQRLMAAVPIPDPLERRDKHFAKPDDRTPIIPGVAASDGVYERIAEGHFVRSE